MAVARATKRKKKSGVAKKGLTLAQKRKKRRYNTQYKQRQRLAMKPAILEQRRVESAMCINEERLRENCESDEKRPGCLIWTGKFRAVWSRIKPYAFHGQYGMMDAQRAMWLALGHTGLSGVGGGANFLKTRCGHDDCIASEHLYLTNTVQQRAFAALGGDAHEATER